MLRPFGRGSRTALVVVMCCAAMSSARGQGREDAAIEQIRGRTNMSATDQRQIREWVIAQVTALEAAADASAGSLASFKDLMARQYGDSRNTAEFQTQLVTQVVGVATEKLSDAAVSDVVSRSLATVLVDFSRIEALDAFLAGLSVKDAGTRVLCLIGLRALQTEIATNADTLQRVVQGLRQCGVKEKDKAVLARVYLALGFANQAAAVFDAYMAVLDARLTVRRGPAVFVARTEVELIEYFRLSGVQNALTPDQKTQLVGRLAVLLRLDATRYAADDPAHLEKDALERRMDGMEAIFAAFVGGGKGGRIRDELEKGGHERRADILRESYKWIGNADSKVAGALNEAPWNVPVGAP